MTGYKRSFRRTILFSLFPLVIVALTVETFGRYAFYNNLNTHSLFLIEGYQLVKRAMLKRSARTLISKNILGIEGEKVQALFSRKRLLDQNHGRRLAESYRKEYSALFENLIKGIRSTNAIPIVLYPEYRHKSKMENEYQLFVELCKKLDIPLIDLSKEFDSYGSSALALLPLNGHLSRFGNQLVATKVRRQLDTVYEHRSLIKYKSRPDIMGDLPPNSDRIWQLHKDMPFKVTTNSQGFRMDTDLVFPAKRQRILILGDSYTFGPHLHNQDTFPGLLSSEDHSREYINAGISGYSITEQKLLWEKNAKYSEPDIVILQVLDNDILSGMTTYKKNLLGKDNHVYQYTESEKQYIKNEMNQGH